MQKKYKILIIIIGLLYFFYIWPKLNSSSFQNELSAVLNDSLKEESEQTDISSNNECESKDTTNENSDIIVDLRGAVANPGIYHLPPDSRVYELIDQAGGFNDANTSCINQAKKLVDESYIYIPYNSEECGDNINLENQSSDSNLININTASVEELSTLPGIGTTKAQDIIDYRTENGNFTSIDELTNVSGIGESTLSSIADLISI